MNATTQAAINNVRAGVLAVLRQIGHASADADATIDVTSIDQDNPILDYPALGIWVGYGPCFKIMRRTINGPVAIPAYAVGEYVTRGATRWQPEETEDVETMRSTSMEEATLAVVGLIVRDLYRNWAMSGGDDAN